MLFEGQVVPVSAISNHSDFNATDPELIFFGNYDYVNFNGDVINRVGRIRRFKKNTAYMAMFLEDTDRFLGYLPEKDFWDTNRISKSKDDTASYDPVNYGDMFSYFPITSFPKEAKIYFGYKFVELNGADICVSVKFGYTLYKDITIFSNYHNVSTPLQTVYINVLPLLNTYGHFILNKQSLRPNGTLAALSSQEEQVLFSIIYVWNEVFNNASLISYLQSQNVYEPFAAHLNLPSRYNSNYGTIDPDYHYLYDQEYFARLRLKLIEFRYWILSYKDNYSKIDANDLIVYVVNLFAPEELSQLSYSTKLNFLDKILKDNLWVTGDWYFNELNEEQAILKIIKSIARYTNGVLNFDEINSFMDLLGQPYDSSTTQTLYEKLYSVLHDTVLFGDDGTGNKGQFVTAIYNLWLESKFNPFHLDSTVAQAALGFFAYTAYNAQWQFDDATISDPVLDEAAAPMLLNYESEKILLWYNTNFKFKFNKDKIQAFEETTKSIGRLLLELGFSIITGPPSLSKYVLFGTYNIFQPIAIQATDSMDTIIQMPVKGVPPNAAPEDYIGNCIPIFYLLYVDNLQKYSNAKEAIGTAIDVALTFTGVGNITKLRHFTKVSLVRKYFTSQGLSTIEQIALKRAVSGLTASVTAIMGVASFAHSFATGSCTVYYNLQNPPQPGSPEYQEFIFCQEVDKWLFALEILSLSGDILAQRAFRRASKKLKDSIPAGTQYDNIRNAVNAMEDLDIVLANFLTHLQTNHPSVFNKVNLWSDEKKLGFLFDFKNQPDILAELGQPSNIHLIDTWNSVEFLIVHRKNVRFLRTYHFIGTDTRCANLRKHILEGEIKRGQAQGIHSRIAETNGHAHIDGILNDDFDGGYYEALVSAIDGSGNLVPKISNGGVNSMLPDSWTKEKIFEEASFAFLNKERVPDTRNQYRGIFTDGRGCILCISGNASQIDNTTKIITFWPDL